jgi:hypothetical protein
MFDIKLIDNKKVVPEINDDSYFEELSVESKKLFKQFREDKLELMMKLNCIRYL